MGNLIKQIFMSDNDSELMSRLKKYARDCSYLAQESCKERIKIYIDCGCNYAKAIGVLGITEKALRASVHYANDALKKKVGEDIVARIENDDPLAELILDIAIMPHKHTVLAEAWNVIPNYKGSYNIKDCKQELQFLLLFSKSFMENNLGLCNMDKLAYLKHLLLEPSSIDRKKSVVLKKHLSNVPNLRQTFDKLFDELKML